MRKRNDSKSSGTLFAGSDLKPGATPPPPTDIVGDRIRKVFPGASEITDQSGNRKSR